MEPVNYFLETSTIHGLSYISTTKTKVIKGFWLVIVCSGFIGAVIIIQQSFQSWEESPIKTTIDTQPIEELKFPKITVCPPKNTYTALNYDIMKTQNMTLDNDTRHELYDKTLELLHDYFSELAMDGQAKMKEKNRYYNWYKQCSRISQPGQHWKYDSKIYYSLRTSAVSGSIHTQYFGDKVDIDKFDADIMYRAWINPPSGYKNNENITLHIVMEGFLADTNKETIRIAGKFVNVEDTKIFEYNPPKNVDIQYQRKMSIEEAMKLKMQIKVMPGINITWFYSGEGSTEICKGGNAVTRAYLRNSFKHFFPSVIIGIFYLIFRLFPKYRIKNALNSSIKTGKYFPNSKFH